MSATLDCWSVFGCGVLFVQGISRTSAVSPLMHAWYSVCSWGWMVAFVASNWNSCDCGACGLYDGSMMHPVQLGTLTLQMMSAGTLNGNRFRDWQRIHQSKWMHQSASLMISFIPRPSTTGFEPWSAKLMFYQLSHSTNEINCSRFGLFARVSWVWTKLSSHTNNSLQKHALLSQGNTIKGLLVSHSLASPRSYDSTLYQIQKLHLARKSQNLNIT